MPPRKKSAAPKPPPLTDADVADLRARVAAGDKPRVVVRAASAAVPAGTRGNVVRLGSPSDGEFIVVRLGRDEVPFAPNELAVTTRGRPPAAPVKAAPVKAAPVKTAPAKGAPVRTAPKAAPASKGPAFARKVAKSSAPARKGAKRRALPPLTVLLRFNDGAWTVEAQRGSRRLSKASPLRPGAVKAFAEHVDDATVQDALTETVEACRSVVAERAQRLRAELDAAEKALREYEARRR